MDRVMDMDSARVLVNDPKLWPRVRDFLWDFTGQIHPSWLEGLNAESRRFIALPRVKARMLDELDVKTCFHTFPKDDWSRLLLLDGATLESISKWLGAIACADSLRHITSGAMVRELKASLAGVYPEVFGYTMYFPTKGKSFEVENANSVTTLGGEMLFSFVTKLSEPLKRRFVLKLAKGFSDFRPSTAKQSTFNLPLLLKLRFPEAYKLCCS